MLLIWLSVIVNAANTFKVMISDDVEMTFHVTDLENRKVEVYASGSTASIATSTEGEIIIPSKVTYSDIEYTVTGISNYAFYQCDKILSVTIPETVTSIGTHVFDQCSELIAVKTKVQRVFGVNKLTFSASICASASLYVPEGTKAIYKETDGWKEFSKIETDSELGAVTFSEQIGSNKSRMIHYRVLSEDAMTVEVCGITNDTPTAIVPSTVNGYTVVRIGKSGLNSTSLRTVSLPNTIISIGDYAFLLIPAKSLVIPESVKSIGAYAFANSDLNTIEIPDAVESIGKGAFSGMLYLKTAVIGCGIKDFGDEVFYDCKKLSSVTIREGATCIGNQAFGRCFSLASISIPNSVTSVGGGIFSGCMNLKIVELGNGIKELSNDMFHGCSSLEEVVIGNNIKSIGDGAFSGCGLLSIELPNSVQSIGNYAFRNCTKLESCILPSTVSFWGRGVFLSCSSLRSLTIPIGVKTIEGFMVAGCSSLESITIPEGVEKIELSAFASGLTSLKTVILPSTITRLEPLAFSGCVNLLFIDLRKCVNLEVTNVDRSYHGLMPTMFSNVPASTIILLPKGNTTVRGENIVNTDDTGVSTCDKLTMYANKDFCVPADFTVTGAVTNPRYLAANDTKIYTLCLPYNYTLPEGVKAYTFKREDDEGSLVFTRNENVEANCPYLLVATSEINNLNTENVLVKATPQEMPNMGSGDYVFRGTLSRIDNLRATDLGIYKLKDDNRWYPTTIENADDYISSGQAYVIPRKGNLPASIKTILEEDENSKFIIFADDEVKHICIENWDTDCDGELSIAEAKAVTDIGEKFRNNRIITSFDEFKYFTGVTVLKYAAFELCQKLETITLPNSLTEIEQAVFAYCQALKGIKIPASVTKMTYLGTSYTNMESMTVEEGNPVYDSRNNCNAIIETATNRIISGCQKTVIPETVTTIGNWAFDFCLEDPIEIPEGVTTIEYGGFFGNFFKSIVLPSTLTDMTSAFYDCLNLIAVESHIMQPFALDERTFNMAEQATLFVPKGTKELYAATEGWNKFRSIVESEEETEGNVIAFADPEAERTCLENWDFNQSGKLSYAEAAAVTDIGLAFNQNTTITQFDELQHFTGVKRIHTNAFREDNHLTSIKLPPSLEVIESSAFLRTRQLAAMELPESLTTIEEAGLRGCGFTAVEIPQGVTAIGEHALYDCRNLTSVTVNWQSPLQITENTFSNYDKMTLTVPKGTKDAYLAADYWKDFMNIVEAGTTVELTAIEGETAIAAENLDTESLTNSVVNGVYYNVGAEGYDATDKSVVISQATNMGAIADTTPGSADVQSNFTGMILKVAQGKGTITLNVKTCGNALLVVQVGNGTPMVASKTEQGDVVVNYDVQQDTYVYVYAILGSSSAPYRRAAAGDVVKIYGIKVLPGATGITNIGQSLSDIDSSYTLDGRKVEGLPQKKGIYIVNRRKVVRK